MGIMTDSFKNDICSEVTETYSLISPLCRHSREVIFSKVKASPVSLSGLTISTSIVVGPGWSVSSGMHSIKMSNKIENRYDLEFVNHDPHAIRIIREHWLYDNLA